MNEVINDAMTQKRNEARITIRASLWKCDTTTAIETAMGAGISEGELGRVQNEIETERNAFNEGNSIDLPALNSELATLEKQELATLAKLQQAQEAHDTAANAAQGCRNRLQYGRNAIATAADMMAHGRIPEGIEASRDVLAAMAADAALAATEKKRTDILKRRNELNAKIADTQARLDGASTSLSRDGNFTKQVQTLEKRLADLLAQKKAVLNELMAFQ